MSQALYRKYRSKSLSELVGQEHVASLLTKALKAGRISHAYLLTGPRGVGKTSVARILAHEINQLPYSEESTHLDIIEIDAASNNGVEDIRDLRDKVQVAPVSASKKIYIIDEVHMLSKPAFNALLKTLEEPPAHVVFILATTDVDKLPATIISRTQRYAFRAISREDAVKHLRHIAEAESIAIDDGALDIVAARGDGSFRDSISLLDQLASLSGDDTTITKEMVEETLGLAPSPLIDELLSAADKHDIATIASKLSAASASGISTSVITHQLIETIKQRVIDQPNLLQLLDGLLDVPKSSYPDGKLLAVLGTFAAAKTVKTAALSVAVPEIKASIPELAKKAVQKKPAEPVQVQAPATKPVETPVERPAPVKSAEFDWDSLVAHARTNYVALFSVLSKCTPEIDGDAVKLYTASAFYKKKLDDAKYSAHLHECLAALGYNVTIDTVPERAPMKDSQSAAIAAIMGGGEEVSLPAA